MNKHIKYFAVPLIALSVFLLHSCKEDTGSLGANVLPKGDLIGAYEIDTSSVTSSMYLKDSVETNNAIVAMLGSYTDPIFGQVKASIYTMVSSIPGGGTPPWDSSGTPTVDSAVLVLPYYSTTSYYGNLDPQTIVVDTMENSLAYARRYFSDTVVRYGTAYIGKQQITPNPLSDTLKIHLNKSWLQSVVARMDANNYYYVNFDTLVKGLYITTENPLQLPGQGAILYINLNGSFAAINIYYHGNTVTNPLQPEYYVSFPVGGTSSIYYTHIDRNWSTAPFAGIHPVGPHDSIPANNLIYVQSAGGVNGRINFPNLHKNWAKKNPMVINQAEIDIPVNTQDAVFPFIPPTQLYLYGTSASGIPYGLPDEGESYYNGTFNPFNNTYTFIITQYIQAVILGKDTDRGLYIVPAGYANTANRVVLYGAQHDAAPTNQKIKLKIYYTPLKP